jgi:histone acetyltransferase (RNA polymerase elongator complex component)
LLLDDCEKYKNYETIVRRRLQIKKGKSQSGIISITVFTSGNIEYTDKENNVQKKLYSCKWDCAYCPNEPGQPRSYLKGEPGVMRANRNNFDCVSQMYDRMKTLYNNGHDIDKLEILVLGGTWESYPEEYRYEFIRDIYYSANSFNDYYFGIYDNNDNNNNTKLSLQEERDKNRYSSCKIIGLTLETRPDTITKESITLFRLYGCTRIQLGIQHIDDKILKTIKRDC